MRLTDGTYLDISVSMPATSRNGGRKIGVILYGLVAGFAATTVIVLGQISLAFFGVWVFHQLGWEQASNSAAHFGFYYIFFIPLGIIVGVIVCSCVWIAGFRNTSKTVSNSK